MSLSSFVLPSFQPRIGWGGAHAQTLAAAYLQAGVHNQATQHVVELPDGDAIVLHEEAPRLGDMAPVVLLLHGLSGCHGSPYMQRMAAKFQAAGVQAVRMDLRGAGAGETLARGHYHLGATGDVLAALRWIAEHRSPSAVFAVGVSLSGNILLRLLGEQAEAQSLLQGAAVISPPIDPELCVRGLQRGLRRLYDRHFARTLWRRIQGRCSKRADIHMPRETAAPRTLFELDDVFTASVHGFADAVDYYTQCGAKSVLADIQTPTLVVTSRDDPLADFKQWDEVPLSPHVNLQVTQRGGHVGWYGRGGVDPDRWWLEWRIVEAVTQAANRLVTSSSSAEKARLQSSSVD